MVSKFNQQKSLEDRINIRKNPITGEVDTTDYITLWERPLIQRLKDLRVTVAHLNQQDFASLVGISAVHLARIEKGTTPFSDELRDKYMVAFNNYPDAGDIFYYLPDAFATAMKQGFANHFAMSKSGWHKRLNQKIVNNFTDLTATAKDFIESSINFSIQQCATKTDIATGLPTYSDNPISMRTMSGWKWGSRHLESYLQKEIWTKLNCKYDRFRIVRGLAFEINEESFMDYEIYTSGKVPQSSEFVKNLPHKFVTQTTIESPYMYISNPKTRPEMTTAGVKVLDIYGDPENKDRELTIFFHYDSYKDKDGKKLKKDDFFKLVLDDLEHTIMPTIEEYLLERDNRYLQSITELANARAQIIMSEGE